VQCHYCSRPADVVAEHDGVEVGLCDDHLRERVATLAETDLSELLEE
jgi:hypothetical protein